MLVQHSVLTLDPLVRYQKDSNSGVINVGLDTNDDDRGSETCCTLFMRLFKVQLQVIQYRLSQQITWQRVCAARVWPLCQWQLLAVSSAGRGKQGILTRRRPARYTLVEHSRCAIPEIKH